MLGITSFFLLATEVLRWDLTITTGLSAKNLVIYLVATFLALRMVVARTSIIAAGPMQAAFIVQIGYAIFTWLIAGLIIEYQGYNLVASGIKLKSGLIDYYIFFLVFLFGVRNAEDAVKVIKWLLLGAIFANLATILDTAGIVNLGFSERIDGRTQGAIGESNQYAAYIILFIPGMIAAAVGSRGLRRLAWLGGALLSCFSLAMTASRGGIVGVVLACVVGAYLFRHLVSYSRIAGWVLGSLVVLVVVMSFSQYGGLLTERVFGQTANIDATEASSGRTEIWPNLFGTMVQQPITFITGFGWNVYWSLPFHFSPHNHYFSLWFNLGLVGLFAGCYLLFGAIGRARRASLVAEPAPRRQLIAFVIGGIAVSGAVFFVELHDPWILLLDVHRHGHAPGAVHRAARRAGRGAGTRTPTRTPRDAYGWTAAQGRGRHEPRRICIVGMDSYGLLSGEGDLQYIGGETVQHVLLARAWRDLGHDVSMIVFDDGQGARRVVDGITDIAAHKRNGGLPGLQFFHPRASKLFAALMAADADVYYQSPAGAFTGITAWFCRMTGGKFIFRVASDSDCEKEHARIGLWRDRKLYDYGLRHADLVAVQTEYQAGMLRENHGLESSVVNMLVEPPRRAERRRERHRRVMAVQPAFIEAPRTGARARAAAAAREFHAGRRGLPLRRVYVFRRRESRGLAAA